MTRPARDRQRGSAMLVTMIVVIALLSGAAVLVSMQVASNRSADITRTGLTSLYCAEAGLDAARPLVAANYVGWSTFLGTGNEPTWLNPGCTCTPVGCTTCAPGINHDIDGDGLADFKITLVNNADHNPLTPTIDNDLSIFVVSTCINPKFPDVQKQVEELVYFSGGGTCYHSQQGNCANNGNFN
jgi:hypothetical protein